MFQTNSKVLSNVLDTASIFLMSLMTLYLNVEVYYFLGTTLLCRWRQANNVAHYHYSFVK